MVKNLLISFNKMSKNSKNQNGSETNVVNESSVGETRKQELYNDFTNKCYEAKVKNTDNQDKIIIAISSGLFGILLASLDKDMFVDNQCAKALLVALLVSNTLTLILSLLSLVLANKAIDKKVEIINSYFNSKEKIEKRNDCETLGKWLNNVYLITGSFTIVILAVMIGIIF